MIRPPADERGSALMLVPAAVLVLLMLGAVAVDSAVVMLAQRDLADHTAAIANDIAGFSLDDPSFYDGDGVTLSEPMAKRYAALAFSDDRRPAGFISWTGTASARGPRTIHVTASADVRYVFAGALPGVADRTTVRAESTATARGG